MGERTVLISGAGIAGAALAHGLERSGWRATVVERAARLRSAGQNVDIRGAGREVIRRMGLEQQVRNATTGERGMLFVNARGAVKATFPAGTSDTSGATAELEILRSELAHLLVEATRHTEYIFGDAIQNVQDGSDRVVVTFEGGAVRPFDLVIGADGVNSATRRRTFGDEPQLRSLDMYMAYFTIPRAPEDDAWARWYNAPRGRVLLLRPDNVGTTRAALGFLNEPSGYEEWSNADQKALLRRRFADVGWRGPRVLDALDEADDLYLELLVQVKMPRWSRGRVALVGDAAYCASPISGMGTSLALVGAHVLAGELARCDDHQAAFRAYEQRMRAYVERAQRLPPGAPRLANPRSRLGIAALHGLLGLVSRAPFGGLRDRLFAPPADAMTLPDYEVGVAA